ncbi:MAG: BamA/TamA family outer membrane protein [Mangrovibacterium sp.]
MRNITSTLLIVLTFCFIASPYTSLAQKNSSKNEPGKEEKQAARAIRKQKKLDSGKLMVSPLAGPGYTPELGFLIGGGALFSWRTDKNDLSLTRSNMPVMLSFTSTGAITLNMRPTTFWNNDNLRINGNFWFKKMPDNYWGVGFNTNQAIDEDKDVTAFERTWLDIAVEALFKIKDDLYFGPNYSLNYTEGSNLSDWVAHDNYFAYYNDHPFNMGIGATFRYDSRDLPANAWEGKYFDVEFTQYGHYLGGNNNYNMLLVDYRQYTRINHKDGRILAWQVCSRNTFGDVPYNELSQLGNPFDLRGYPWGKYRNKGKAYAVVEYRHTFKKKSGDLSKYGAVAWVGGGTVYDTDNDPLITDKGTGFLPNGGIGFRYELQPRMNLRLDYGIGRNGLHGFYFNINETF